jgi:hypothetical protein
MFGTTGPNVGLVEHLLDRVEALDPISVQRLFHAWSGLSARTHDPLTERRVLATARDAARQSGRLDAFDRARSDAAARLRHAHRGDPGPWLSLSVVVANAAAALVVADLLDAATFDWLYRPWRVAVEDAEELEPVGPGHVPFGTITQRRRPARALR